LVELASSNTTRTAMVSQARREPATTAAVEPRLVPVEVVTAGSALPGLGKESALRNVTPPKGNGAGAVALGAEVQVLRGFSVGKDLSGLIGWLTGQDPNQRTRLGPVELLGGGYATATLELADLERFLPGGNPRQTDPDSTRIKRAPSGATEQSDGQLLPDDPNGPSARWKAFAIATGPTWPGRDGNDAQYTWRLGLGDALGKEYGPTNVLVDYGMARNNVQRVDFDLYGDRGALATGAVRNTHDARMPLQLNVIDIGGGNVKFAGPVPLRVRVQSATSLPAALLRNLPAAGSEVWEWTEPAAAALGVCGWRWCRRCSQPPAEREGQVLGECVDCAWSGAAAGSGGRTQPAVEPADACLQAGRLHHGWLPPAGSHRLATRRAGI
jgi:hypothetical protein